MENRTNRMVTTARGSKDVSFREVWAKSIHISYLLAHRASDAKVVLAFDQKKRQ
jgi:hypothetical protein